MGLGNLGKSPSVLNENGNLQASDDGKNGEEADLTVADCACQDARWHALHAWHLHCTLLPRLLCPGRHTMQKDNEVMNMKVLLRQWRQKRAGKRKERG